MFNLKSKLSCGEFSGDVHKSTITALAISKQCTHLLSGDERGIIGIWRIKDQQPLHSLVVRNTSKVVSLSMHESGRMLLALYANGVLRLWNMLDARCLFKFKAGMSANAESEADEDDKEEEEKEEGDKEEGEKEEGDEEAKKEKKEEAPKSDEVKKVLEQFAQMNSRSVQVKWEPTQGK